MDQLQETSNDSDTHLDEKGDFAEYQRYATLRNTEVTNLQQRLQAHLPTVTSDAQFTAILANLEKMKCAPDASYLS